jgi:hypothetical protein
MSGPYEHRHLSLADPARIARLGEGLNRLGYAESAILRLLGADELPATRARRQALPLYLWRTRGGTPLETLVRLFLLRQPVGLEAAGKALAPLADWAESGLLHVGPGEVRATVELCPFEGLVLAADWPGPAAPGVDPVMGVAASSRALAQMTVRRRAARALDLGAGGGVQALLAAAHCEQVWAVDLNPRSVPLARLSACLNGRSNVTCLQGDLFEPVRGQEFDLIVCNPPFVIAPGRGWLHTHSGRPADALCRAIVRAAPALLREGGYCQVLCNWACLNGQDWHARLAEWFADTGCDAWVLHSHTEGAPEYALKRIGEMGEGPDESARRFDEWVAYFEQERIEAVGFGVVTLRRAAGRPNWFRYDPMPPALGPCGAAIEQGFALRDFLEANRGDRELLAARLRRAPNLRWERQEEAQSGRWATAASRLRLTSGLAFTGNAEPEVAAFVARCTGGQRLGDALRDLAAATGQDVSRLTPAFLKVVRRLIELGFLLPTEYVGS